MVKHAGANWLINSKRLELSPLGIKVANVLAQLYAGIYNVPDLIEEQGWKFKRIDWIAFDTPYQVASFDKPDLTILFFCCQKAGLILEIRPKDEHQFTLKFEEQNTHPFPPTYAVGLAEGEISDFESMVREYCPFSPEKCLTITDREMRGYDLLWRHHEAGKLLSVMFITTGFYHREIAVILANAHSSCTRVSLEPGDEDGLAMAMFVRQRTGDLYQRHPDISTAKASLEGVWDVDYDSTT